MYMLFSIGSYNQFVRVSPMMWTVLQFLSFFIDFQSSDSHLHIVCELLGVRADDLVRWLCNRRLVLVAETVVKPLHKDRAVNSRDALAKRIYALLFNCVINRINKALQVPGKQHAFIGVLDIYG